MSIERKRRKGTTAEHSSFVGANSEFTYNSDNDRIIAHDAVTANAEQIIPFKGNNSVVYGDSTGTNDLTCTIDFVITALSFKYFKIFTKAPNDNTGAMTINVNSTGSVPIKDVNGNDLVAGDIKQNFIMQLMYNNTTNVFELINFATERNKDWVKLEEVYIDSSGDFTDNHVELAQGFLEDGYRKLRITAQNLTFSLQTTSDRGYLGLQYQEIGSSDWDFDDMFIPSTHDNIGQFWAATQESSSLFDEANPPNVLPADINRYHPLTSIHNDGFDCLDTYMYIDDSQSTDRLLISSMSTHSTASGVFVSIAKSGIFIPSGGIDKFRIGVPEFDASGNYYITTRFTTTHRPICVYGSKIA